MDPRENAPVHTATDVARLLGITYAEDELAGFGPPPDPLAGFVTLFDTGSTIVALCSNPTTRGSLFPQSWYDREPFAATEDAPRYRQVRMGPVPDSLRKTYAEQIALLPEGEEVPPARVVVTAVVTHFLATGERLLPDVYVRCADKTSRGARVGVGDFGSDGLYVGGDWGVRFDDVGLASARKF